MDKNYNLRPLWDAILDIYKAFAEVCDRHGLRYYATGGTALGAMRHGGFIPWDDDFDLVMPRPDYIKFFETCHKELPGFCKAVDFRNNPESEMFGKVYETREQIVNKVIKESNLNISQGIFIDIIPIDGMPKASIPFYFWIWGRMTWRKANEIHLEPKITRPFWKLSSMLLKVPSDKLEWGIAFERWLSKWNYDSSPAVDDYNTNPRRLNHRVLTSESFGKARIVAFDKIKVPVPNEVEKFLVEIYGNWKCLPPIEQQVPSHQIK